MKDAKIKATARVDKNDDFTPKICISSKDSAALLTLASCVLHDVLTATEVTIDDFVTEYKGIFW